MSKINLDDDDDDDDDYIFSQETIYLASWFLRMWN